MRSSDDIKRRHRVPKLRKLTLLERLVKGVQDDAELRLEGLTDEEYIEACKLLGELFESAAEVKRSEMKHAEEEAARAEEEEDDDEEWESE